MTKKLIIEIATDEVYYGSHDHTLDVIIDMLERFVEDLKSKERWDEGYCPTRSMRRITRGIDNTEGTLEITEENR